MVVKAAGLGLRGSPALHDRGRPGMVRSPWPSRFRRSRWPCRQCPGSTSRWASAVRSRSAGESRVCWSRCHSGSGLGWPSHPRPEPSWSRRAMASGCRPPRAVRSSGAGSAWPAGQLGFDPERQFPPLGVRRSPATAQARALAAGRGNGVQRADEGPRLVVEDHHADHDDGHGRRDGKHRLQPGPGGSQPARRAGRPAMPGSSLGRIRAEQAAQEADQGEQRPGPSQCGPACLRDGFEPDQKSGSVQLQPLSAPGEKGPRSLR